MTEPVDETPVEPVALPRFLAVGQMASDPDLRLRLLGCFGLEGDPRPEFTLQQHLWQIVSRADWANAWTYALATGKPLDGLGADELVISDQMILSAVQAVRS